MKKTRVRVEELDWCNDKWSPEVYLVKGKGHVGNATHQGLPCNVDEGACGLRVDLGSIVPVSQR